MRLLLVEDHDLLAHTLQMALSARGHEVQRLNPASKLSLLAAVTEQAPDLVLLDMDLGDGVPSGELLVSEMVEAGAAVLLVTGSHELGRIAAGLDAGAAGYVPKTEGLDALCTAVDRVAAGDPATPQGALADLRRGLEEQAHDESRRLAPFCSLTESEQAVLEGLMAGIGAEDLARRRHVSVATIRSQVRSVLRKLDVHSQLEAVALANRAGWSADQS